MTKWIFEELQKHAFGDKKIVKFIQDFKSKINFNYKPDGESLLERYINNLQYSINYSSNDMADILSHEKIDFSIHKNLLEKLFWNEKYLDIVNIFIQNGINFDSIDGIDFREEAYSQYAKETIVKLLEKLSPNKLSKYSYSIIKEDNIDLISYILTIDNLGKALDLNYSYPNQSTMLELMIEKIKPENIILYIDKYKPDLSRQTKVISYCMSQKPADLKLIQKLLSCGAPITTLSFETVLDIYASPEILSVFVNYFDAWNKEDLTKWLHKNINTISSSISNVVNFIKLNKSKINFDYKDKDSNCISLGIYIVFTRFK